MTLVDVFYSLFNDYTLRTVALGAGVLGAVSGSLGSFAVLRRQSLLGDAISHTALPGIALAFLLTGSRMSLVLMIGAGLAGWLGTMAVMSIVRHSRVKQDTALGMVLAVFFGFGLVLLTYVQRMPQAGKAGLDKFLFGQASALLASDVWTMTGVGAVALVIMMLFWKEFKILSFDQEFGLSMGFSMKLVDIILTTLLVAAIVIGLQTVGVVLMSAMVVAPAAAARQWTDRLGLMVLLAGCFGALAGVSGAVISSLTERLPTGPTVVLCVSAIVLLSMLFAPNRGLLYRRLRGYRRKRRMQLDAVLLDLHELAEHHGDTGHPHPVGTLRPMSRHPHVIKGTLQELRERGWANESEPGLWQLTSEGAAEARRRLEQIGSNR